MCVSFRTYFDDSNQIKLEIDLGIHRGREGGSKEGWLALVDPGAGYNSWGLGIVLMPQSHISYVLVVKEEENEIHIVNTACWLQVKYNMYYIVNIYKHKHKLFFKGGGGYTQCACHGCTFGLAMGAKNIAYY